MVYTTQTLNNAMKIQETVPVATIMTSTLTAVSPVLSDTTKSWTARRPVCPAVMT